MRIKLTILLFTLLLNLHTKAGDNVDVALENEIRQEQYIPALHSITHAFRHPANKSTERFSYYLYQTTECIFRLRCISQLERLFSVVDQNAHKIHPYYLARIQVIRLNYLKEKGSLPSPKITLQKNIDNCPYADVQLDYSLSLASYYLSDNNIPEAEKLYRKIYASANSDTIQRASSCNGIGACFAYNSRYDSATVYYNQAVSLFSAFLGSNHSRTAQVKFNLALVANKFGEYNTSEQLLLEVLSVYKAVFGEQHIRTAEAYGALGSVFMLEDNLEKALYYVRKERDVLSKLYGNAHPDLAYSYLNTGKIYKYQHELLPAEQEIRNGILILTQAGKTDNDTYLQLSIELAEILKNSNNTAAASTLLESLLKTKQVDDEFRADIYLQLGDTYLMQQQYDKAEGYYLQADKIYNSIYGNKNIFSVDANIALSKCNLQKGLLEKANQYAYVARQKTVSNGSIIFPYDHWECRLQEMNCIKALLDRHLLDRRHIVAYIENIKSILSEAKRIKQTYYSNGSQLHYAEKMAELNSLGIYFLTHFYQKTDAYFVNNLLFFAENNKANLLRNKISNDASNELLPPAQQQQSGRIVNRLNYFIALNENQTAVSFNINDSILHYQEQYEQFTKTIEKEYPKVYRLKYGEQPLSIAAIQQNLSPNHTLLEYCNDGDHYYCLAISPDNITYKVCGNKHYLDSLIAQHRQSIAEKKSNAATNQLLCQSLLPKVLSYHLLLSPDAAIYSVAFDALTTGKDDDYLVFHHTTQYTFSAATYFHHPPSDDKKNILAFYPDFTHTAYAALDHRKEHEALKLFSNYAVFYKEKAIKSTFLQSTHHAGIIHVASHLITDSISPLQSFLVFQPNNDFKLTINEIWKMNTNCQLITLASCQSNFGKQQNGEGVQNFAWAFHYAGARNVLSTQWNASDKATSAILSNFYKNLKNGKSKQDALQLAKIDYLKSADAIGIEPFFWSNFCLYGDDSRLHISPHFLVKFWYTPVFLLLLCYLAMLFFRKLYSKKRYEHL